MPAAETPTPVYEQLRRHIDAFNQSPKACLRRQVIWGGFGVLGFFILAFAAIGSWWWSVGAIALGLLTLLAYFTVRGVAERTRLFGKVMRLIASSSAVDWVVIVVAILVGVATVVVLNLFAVVIASVVIAVAMTFTIDRMVAEERRTPLSEIEELLKSMRRQGMEDPSLRKMICEYGGATWEPVFEAIFGYEAKLEARGLWGRDELGRARPKDRAWRDVVVRWIDQRQISRQKEEAADVPPAPTANEPSRLPMPKVSQEVKEAEAEYADIVPMPTVVSPPMPTELVPPTPAATPSDEKKEYSVDPARLERERKRREMDESLFGAYPQGVIAAVLSARVRFLLGAALLVACLTWMQQNNLVPEREIVATTKQVIEDRSLDNVQVDDIAQRITSSSDEQTTNELTLPHVPPLVTRWLSGYGTGIAGLILIFSAFFRGVKIAFFVFPAAAVVLFCSMLPFPAVGPIPQAQMSWVVGGALAGLGVLFGRVKPA